VFRREGVDLVPWFGLGEVADWLRVQRERLSLAEMCTFVRLVTEGTVAEFSARYTADYHLSIAVAGSFRVTGLAFPVTPGDVLRCAIYAFGPSGQLMPAGALAALRGELEASLVRIGGPAPSPEPRQPERESSPTLH
jgi:hypothetical protein